MRLSVTTNDQEDSNRKQQEEDSSQPPNQERGRSQVGTRVGEPAFDKSLLGKGARHAIVAIVYHKPVLTYEEIWRPMNVFDILIYQTLIVEWPQTMQIPLVVRFCEDVEVYWRTRFNVNMVQDLGDVAIYGELPTDMVSRVDADLSRFLDRGVI